MSNIRRSFILILSMGFMATAVLACGWFPDSPVFDALINGDTSAFCAPFKITTIQGLPVGPAHIFFNPLPPATAGGEGATDYRFIDEFGDAAIASPGDIDVQMPFNGAMAQYNIDHGQSISFFATALTNSPKHPLCDTQKVISFTKTEKKSKPVQSPTPQSPNAGNKSTSPVDDRCKVMQFVSAIPYGPARITWTPFQHGYMPEDEPYAYWYNVVITATTVDHTTLPLVNEWVKEPGVLPQAQNVKGTFQYQLPPAKRIYSYTVQVTGGYASADYPDHLSDGKGYIEPACTISRTMLVTATPTPMPPTVTPVPTQAPQSQQQPPQSHLQQQPPKQTKSCPPGTTGDPSKGIPCIPVPK